MHSLLFAVILYKL